MGTKTFESWGIIEVFGHQRFAGFIREETIGGASFIRIDVPEFANLGAFTKLFGASSIYSITPTTEEIARGVAQHERRQPITHYDLPVELRQRLNQTPAITHNHVHEADFENE